MLEYKVCTHTFTETFTRIVNRLEIVFAVRAYIYARCPLQQILHNKNHTDAFTCFGYATGF